jgi:phosphatidylglycerophosphatase A
VRAPSKKVARPAQTALLRAMRASGKRICDDVSVPDPVARSRPPLWATVVATSFGAGFMPKAPGHTGTLTAVPLAWGLAKLGTLAYVAGIVVVTAIGTVAAGVFARATGVADNQKIVIDEVAGYLVTLSLVPRTVGNLILGFFLFRLFDVWKPGFIRLIDRKVKGGFGIMADDLAAGAVAALCLFAIDRAHVIAYVVAWAHA